MRLSPRVRSVVHGVFILALLLAMVPLQPVIPAAAGSGDDEFSSTTLGSQWHWVREDSSHWSLTANPGWMRLITQATDLTGSSNTAPLLLQAAPTGDFSLTTRLQLTASQNNQQAGLLIYTNDDNYVRLTAGYQNGSQVMLGKEINGSYQQVQSSVSLNGTLYLQLVKVGQSVIGYDSSDGSSWTPIGQFGNVTITPTDVGLLAFNGAGSTAPEVAADFDYFHEQDLPCTTSTANDNFSAGTLDPKWSWVREDPTHWTLVSTPDPATIYADSLASGWYTSLSWDATIDPSNTSPVHYGSDSISYTATAGWAGLQLTNDAGINTAGYTALRFAMRSTTDGEPFAVYLRDTNYNDLGSPLPLSSYGGYPVSGGWTVYTIPLADLNASNVSLGAIVFHDWSGTAQPTVYLDDIQLINTPYTVYSDSLTSPWYTSLSWDATIDPSNTSPVHYGSDSISYTATAGWAGLQLTNDAGINTAGYTALRFAMRSTTDGEPFAVYLRDTNYNDLGSPLPLSSYGGYPVSGGWTVYTIPLADLNASNVSLGAIVFHDWSGTAQPTVYLDDIQLIDTAGSGSSTSALRILTQNTDLYQSTNTAPVLLQTAPSGDFDLTTHVSLTPTQNNQQAGLVVYHNDDNYLRLTYGYINGGLKFEFGKEINASFVSFTAAAPPEGGFDLRIRKTGQTFTGAYSVDGTTWTDIGQYLAVPVTMEQIGLLAFNGGSAAEIPADFSSFNVESFMCPATGGTTPPSVSGTTNVYDALGRLVAVIDPSSDTAVYHYDAVGNLLSISRQSSALASIIQVTPGSGAVGRSVTIDGTGFSTDSSQDSVSFNGTAATVTSATATKLTVTVPSGATSGPIAITTPAGSATSSTDFTVTSGQAPTITGVSPSVGAAGTSVTLTGTNFADLPDNEVTFNGTRATVTSASSTSLTVTVPPPAVSGPITVTTPDGAGTSSADFVVPPSGVSAGSIESTTRLAIGGSEVVTLNTPNDVDIVLFDGQAGQRVSMQLSNSTISATYVWLYAPDGTLLVNHGLDQGYFLASGMTLPATGTYTILLAPPFGFTGHQTVTLFSVPADPTSTIVPGGAPVNVTTTVPGENARVSFDGTANQRVSLNMGNNTYGTAHVSILNPDGSALYNRKAVSANDVFLDTQTLPTTGTYTILVDPDGGYTGSMTLTLYDVPADTTGSIVPGGSAVTVTNTVPGQNNQLTFSGTANQRVSLGLSNNSYATAYISILNPDGSALISRHADSSTNDFIDVQTLPSTGTYTILVDPKDGYTGSMTLTLYDVPADTTGSIVPGGSAVTVTNTVPGQNNQLTFSGTANQRVSLGLSNNSDVTAYISILNPDGSALISRHADSSTNDFIDVQTLPTTGTYTILVDPSTGYTGSMTLSLYDVPADTTGSIVPDGSAVTVTSTVPGQNNQLTFDGTANQQVNLSLTNNSDTLAYISIFNPDGSTLVNRHADASDTDSIGPLTLPSTGTYTILVDPSTGYTGSLTLTLSTVTGFQSSSVVLATMPISGTTTVLGDLQRASPAGSDAGSGAHGNGGDNGNGNGNGNGADHGQGNGANSGQDESWTPLPWNEHGDWRRGGGQMSSLDQGRDPLQAGPGVTALSGRVLLYNGNGLKNVTVSVDNQTTQTDAHGQFLLTGLTAGHHVLIVDGRSANHGNRTYALFQIGVDLTANQTTVLNYVVWMPRLDTANDQTFSSPTNGEVVLTTPKIPGLEVHIPAGSVIKDAAGNVVTSLGITAIPVDQPPFPLPFGVQVPIYFTVQPAGTSVMPDGAYIVYPNYTGQAPGSRVDFWHYDPQSEGWYIYGKGTVTPDGKQIVPDPGVRLYEFTGAMIGSSGNPPSTYPAPGAGSNAGDPVDLGTGLFVLHKTDLVEPDTLPLNLTRTYRPNDNTSRTFGVGADDQYDMYLWSNDNFQQADLVLPDGSRIHYVRTSPGTDYTTAVYTHTATPTAFYESTLAWNGTGWSITLKDGTVYNFRELGPLLSIRDRYGNTISIIRTNGTTGNITELRSSNGRWIQFTYDSSDRITAATDNIGRTVSYTYDASGHLATVTDPLNGVTTYSYDANGRMSSIEDAKGITFLTNTYDANGRVIQQTQADNTTYSFAYTLEGNGKVTQTDVTDPNGNVRSVTFNSAGYPLTDTAAAGTSEAQTVTYTRDTTSNLITSVTDALGRESDFVYDSMGNLTSVTRLAGTANAVTTTMTYDSSAYNQLASVTDPLSHTTTFSYDSVGNLVKVTDPLGHQTTLGYNSAGQPTSIVDALGNTTQLHYTLGDLTSATDPQGNTTTRWVDNAGRPVTVTGPLGSVTSASYNALNEITAVTDALGGVTSYAYDANGNLTSLTDANNHTTSWTYDNMDRVTGRTDPLNNSDTYGYDNNGNLTSVTDRNGQTTSVTYDALNRPGTVTFGDASTLTYTFDAGNRLTQLVDSLNGTISESYDNLDQLTQETTPQGTVNYSYDTAGRRTSMTVAGQTEVDYSYDNANRLTQITQGSATVSFGYDQNNRRTTLTLPNGITVDYGYDTVGNLTSLTYSLSGTTLGDLQYGYDANGLRTQIGGSWARTSLPAAVTGNTYNADNQLTSWNGSTLSYDTNGNLTSDGTTTYSWDARNQLSSLTGPTNASFTYDGFGRRTSSTVNGTTTGYLYDGANLVQELSGGTPSANMLTGLGIDETFSRTDSSGTSTFLSDALGSTLALANSSGSVQTSYTYSPFGTSSSTGASSSNTQQYTGLPNDGTGLQYNRARYYSPTLQRFISEDPLGFGGGSVNLYVYAENCPLVYTDPSGMLLGHFIHKVTSALASPEVRRALDEYAVGASAVAAAGAIGIATVGCAASALETAGVGCIASYALGVGAVQPLLLTANIASALSTAGGCIAAERVHSSSSACWESVGETAVSWGVRDPIVSLAGYWFACRADGGCRSSSSNTQPPGPQIPEWRSADVFDGAGASAVSVGATNQGPYIPGDGVPLVLGGRQCGR